MSESFGPSEVPGSSPRSHVERLGLYRRRGIGGRRPHRVVIRHNDEEYARVLSLAAAQGVSAPRLYERALHAGDVMSAARLTQLITEARVVIRLMGKTAVNINQVATVANATGEVRAEELLAAARYFDKRVEQMEALLAAAARGGVFDTAGDDDAQAVVEAEEEASAAEYAAEEHDGRRPGDRSGGGFDTGRGPGSPAAGEER